MAFFDGVIFILTEACNAHCTMCNYWRVRDPRALPSDDVIAFGSRYLAGVPGFVTLSGGEPLVYDDVYRIASFYRKAGRTTVLCTNGLLVSDHVDRICGHFDKVIVSLHGSEPRTHDLVLGLRSYETVLDGVQRLLRHPSGPRVIFKMTVQRRNYRDVPGFLGLARDQGVSGVAIAAPDVYSDAFHQHTPTESERRRVLLDAAQIAEFGEVVDQVYADYGADIRDGFIIEGNLRMFVEYFKYYAGLRADPPPRDCVIPGNRLIVGPDGAVRLCFFHDAVGSIYREQELEDLLTPPRLLPVVAGMNACDSAICRNCSQFLNWNF